MPGAKKKALKHKLKEKKRKHRERRKQQKQQHPPQQQQQQNVAGDAAHNSDVTELLTKAELAYAEMRFDECIQTCDEALSATGGAHPVALETKALALLQMEQTEQAHALLQQCVQLAPDEGASKYLYLGQMSYGEEAAQALGKGIELMAGELAQMQGSASEEEIQEHQEAISAAFCSLAEVYLTDLCEVDEAQDTCLALMEKALDYDPNSVQALQTLASIHISLLEPDKAREYLYRSLDQWWGLMKRRRHGMDEGGDDDDANADQEGGGSKGGAGKEGKDAHDRAMAEAGGKTGTGGNEAEDDDSDDLATAEDAEEKVDDELEQLPPYEARINAAKMLIELEDYDTALELLDLLIAEDDSIMQVWYLQGWTLHLKKDMEAAKESLQRAKRVYVASQADRPEVLQHIEELLGERPPSQMEEEEAEEGQ